MEPYTQDESHSFIRRAYIAERPIRKRPSSGIGSTVTTKRTISSTAEGGLNAVELEVNNSTSGEAVRNLHGHSITEHR